MNEYFYVVEIKRRGCGDREYTIAKSGVIECESGTFALNEAKRLHNIGDNINQESGAVVTLNRV